MASVASHVLFTSAVSDQNTGCIYDFSTGNSLKVYKRGGVARINSFQQLGNDYIITVNQDKPLLHIWNLNKQDDIQELRTTLPNIAKALAISPDNGFLTVAIGTSLHTWEINTGLKLSVINKHLLPITCLKFAGYYLISASESGEIITFAHTNLISIRTRKLGQIEPRYKRNDHTNIITDIHVGSFGVRSRFLTVSTDCNAHVYQAATGELLLKLILNSPLTCVIADKMFNSIFIGTNVGQIIHYCLSDAPRTLTDHVSLDNKNNYFSGHTKQITCLDIHLNNRLASGSLDHLVYIWNVYSKTVLHVIDLKGPVTNVRFIWNHFNIYAENFQPKYIVKPLRREIDNDEEIYSIINVNNQKEMKFI